MFSILFSVSEKKLKICVGGGGGFIGSHLAKVQENLNSCGCSLFVILIF